MWLLAQNQWMALQTSDVGTPGCQTPRKSTVQNQTRTLKEIWRKNIDGVRSCSLANVHRKSQNFTKICILPLILSDSAKTEYFVKNFHIIIGNPDFWLNFMIFYTVFPNFRDHNSELHQCFPFKTSLVFLSGPVVFISGVFDIRGYPYHSFAEPFTDFELRVTFWSKIVD